MIDEIKPNRLLHIVCRITQGMISVVICLCIILCLGCVLVGCRNQATKRSTNSIGEDAKTVHWAALMGDEDLTKHLLQRGADIDELDSHGRATPLGVAADAGNTNIVRLLIERGANVNKACPLYYAAQKGHLQIAKMLLDAGAEPNRFRIGKTPSPLLAAARSGHLDVVKLLVEHGSELGTTDGDNSPLIAAAVNNHSDVVDYLAEKGDSVDAADSDGRTALYMAAAEGLKDVVAVLIKHGANPDHKTHAGKTPKQIAIEQGHKMLVKIMEETPHK